MIGPEYTATLISAIIGTEHSPLFPETYWGAWLDATGTLIEETGIEVPHDSFGEIPNGAANVDDIDAGQLPAGAEFFALMDTETGGNVVIMTRAIIEQDVGDPIVFEPGDLQFLYGPEPTP